MGGGKYIPPEFKMPFLPCLAWFGKFGVGTRARAFCPGRLAFSPGNHILVIMNKVQTALFKSMPPALRKLRQAAAEKQRLIARAAFKQRMLEAASNGQKTN